MTIKEVTDKTDKAEFINLPVRLYRDCPTWIRPLDKDIESVFDPAINKTFRHGKCCRWLLKDDGGRTIGRVAAFLDEKTSSKGNDQPTGGLGFFECINDRQAAYLLFDQCKDWLQAQGMQAMDGPINFGTRERWWGLLVEGFDKEPNYQCNYNFAYYKDFFEDYGFQVYFEQFTFARKVMDPLSEKLAIKARQIEQTPGYTFHHLQKSEVVKLPDYIRTVYNNAWANRSDIPELTLAQAKIIVKQMKPIMDRRLVYFGFYHGEPVSFFISLPEINQVFKYVNGKLDWIGKIKFLWHTFRKTNKKAFGILFGIVPAHQGKGLDGAMVLNASRILQVEKRRYDEYEMNWIGDFNPKMIVVVKQVGAVLSKKHYTYRKLFDNSKPFKRHPILN